MKAGRPKIILLKSLTIALALSAALLIVVALSVHSTPVAQAEQDAQCVTDVNGTNDESDPDDLTEYCVDVSQADPITVTWKWDTTNWRNDTGSACALFDEDTNGRVDFAYCITVAKASDDSGSVSTGNTALLYWSG